MTVARGPAGAAYHHNDRIKAATMTAQDLRDLALGLPEATKPAHVGHPD